MKKLLTILFLLLTLNLSAQKHEAWKTVGVYSSSILLEATGAGLNLSGHQDWGHVLQASSVGVLITSPFIIEYQKEKWGWYIASYVGLRVGLFDYALNAAAGLPLDYRGDSNFWDQAINELNPPNNAFFGRAVFFTVGFAIPFNEIYKKHKRY